MRGGDNVRSAHFAEVIDDSNAERRTFFGIRSRPDFIEQHKRGRFAKFHHACDVGNV